MSPTHPGPNAVALTRQPPGLYLLFLVEMWERFSYYGMRALLILYLVSLPATAVLYQTSSDQSVTLRTGDEVTAVSAMSASDSVKGTVVGLDNGALLIKPQSGIDGAPLRVDSKWASRIDVTTPANPGPGWSRGHATQLYGWYTGLVYLFPIIGGLIADRFIGTHRSMIVGGLLIATGHIVLALTGMVPPDSAVGVSAFIGGLALIVFGTGHFKPCVSVMVGQLYSQHDPRRDGAFTIFYMGINLGAFICAFVCGTLGEKVGWHWGFGSAAVGMILGLAIYMIYREKYLHNIGLAPAGKRDSSAIFFALSCVLAGIIGIAWHSGIFSSLGVGLEWLELRGLRWMPPAIALIGVAVFSWWLISAQAPVDRGPVVAILVFILFNTFFWMAFEQAGSTLNLFADNNTDRMLGSWEFPASWFQSVNPLLILLLSPLFAGIWSRLGARGRDPSQAVKIGLGLLFLGVGYVVIVLGARENAVTGAQVAIWWLIGTYFFHTLGELCVSPTGLSFVTKVAPVKFVSLLMGVWFLSSFAAGVIGGQVGSFVDKIGDGSVSLPWYGWFRLGGEADFYFLFVITSVVGGVVCIALAPSMKKLLHGRE